MDIDGRDPLADRLRAIADALPALVSYVDLDGRYQFANKAYGEWFGLNAESLRGAHLREVLGDEAFERIRPHVEAALAGGHVAYEQELPYKGGGARFVHAEYVPDAGSDGSVRGFYALVTDISERKRAELELQQSERRFASLSALAPVGLFETDVEGNCSYVNERWCGFAGMRPDEAMGRGWVRALHPDDRERVLREWNESARAGTEFSCEYRFVKEDGVVTWLSGSGVALRDEAGGVRGYIGTVTDITERKRIEAELREAEEQMRSVVDHVVDGIITIDERGTVQSLNPAALRIFGYRADEVIGRNVKMLMPEPYHGEHDEYLRNYLRTGAAKIIGLGREVVGRCQDGSVFPMELAVSEFRIAEKRYFTGIVRDITERKRLEQELHRRISELADADRQKNDFLAMLAHELRNPLAPMRNALHLMRMPGANEPMAQSARDIMERQLQHLVRLVDDLLDVSRIVRGKIELRRERLELSEAVVRAVETARPVLDLHGHELITELPEEPVRIEGDLIRVAQVLANLLTNAAKYTDRPGRIHLAVSREGDEAVIRVRDTGIGIEPGLLPHVFDLFVQGDGSLARSRGGLGIGLTLVRRLVELHGGTVSASSEGPGRGSEFAVRLPLASGERIEDGPGQPSSASPARRARCRRVLVVDDNVDAADSVALILRNLGHSVRCAYDGLVAIAEAEQYRPDVVVLDIGLPGKSGYEVARHLRRSDKFRRTPLVAVTGYARDEDQRRSREAGFDFHLTKPVDPDVLQQIIERPVSG